MSLRGTTLIVVARSASDEAIPTEVAAPSARNDASSFLIVVAGGLLFCRCEECKRRSNPGEAEENKEVRGRNSPPYSYLDAGV